MTRQDQMEKSSKSLLISFPTVKMKVLPQFSLFYLVILLAMNCDIAMSQDAGARCEKGQFYHRFSGQCKPCSLQCPEGHIRIPCQRDSDLICKIVSSEILELRPSSFDKSNLDLNEELQDENLPMPMEREDQEYWKALAFALIGLLSILIVATVAVLIACFRLQRAVALKQQEELEIVDTDSDYVVIRAIRSSSDPRHSQDLEFGNDDLPSHPMLSEPTSDYGGSDSLHEFHLRPQQANKLCFLPKVYNPQRRLLTYDADDVFESEDSGGSVKFPSLPGLKTIPERSDAHKISNENSLQHGI